MKTAYQPVCSYLHLHWVVDRIPIQTTVGDPETTFSKLCKGSRQSRLKSGPVSRLTKILRDLIEKMPIKRLKCHISKKLPAIQETRFILNHTQLRATLTMFYFSSYGRYFPLSGPYESHHSLEHYFTRNHASDYVQS